MTGSGRRPRIVYIATDPVTPFRLMDGQLAYMKEQGFDVSVIAGPGELLDRVAEREGVPVYGIAMRREMAPGKDIGALFALVRMLRRLKPDLVNAGTPKAGLLGVIAARLARVPTVVYLLRGLRFEGASGGARLILALAEHVCGGLSHRVFCNSQSLRDRFVALGCASAEDTFVPAHGTSNGVDVDRFVLTPETRAWATAERARLGIAENAMVVGFVGRLARDKGIPELVASFRRLASETHRPLHLLLVGWEDDTDPLPQEVGAWTRSASDVTVTGYQRDPTPYYALMDVFAFPSFREGFPNAPLEAASAGLPCVAFRATGTVDAVAHEVTGLLVSSGDVVGFADALRRYVDDPELSRRHGENARRRVGQLFRREVVWAAVAAEYRRLLGA